jgi:hypothetical protein
MSKKKPGGIDIPLSGEKKSFCSVKKKYFDNRRRYSSK